jgi:hypothetical protein
MRKLLLIAALGIASLTAAPAKAQVSLSVNIGTQPQWGPSGYDHVDYYYLPEVESYYYVPTRQFIYYSGNTWIHSRSLPSRYRHYDLYSGRKVVINSPRPYLHHVNYRSRYGGPAYGYNRPARVVVRNHYRNDNRRYDNQRNNYRARTESRGRGNDHDRGGNKFGHGKHH